MILTEFVEVNTNPANKKHFQGLGYDITKKILTVPICHLSKGSHAKILVGCDVCGNEKITEYGDYMKKFNNGGFYVCKKCQQHKTGKTNMIKYGFECASQNKKTKEKSEQTNLERYGVKSSSQNKEVQDKMKQTNLERYGSLSPMESDIFKEKSKQTNLKKYGVEFVSQNEEIKEKIKQTNLEKYGGTLMGSDMLKRKFKKMMVEMQHLCFI